MSIQYMLDNPCSVQEILGGGNKFVVQRDVVNSLHVTLANPQTYG